MIKKNKEELIAIYEKLNIPEHGRKIVERIRTSEPSRLVKSNGQNVKCRYPSVKMRCVIQAESHTVELPFIYLHEFDNNVLEYYDQPEPIKIKYKVHSGKLKGHSHTPDFFEITKNRIGYVECKAESELKILHEKWPNRYVIMDDGSYRCPPGEEAAHAYGLSYRIWSTKNLNMVLIENIEFLADYYHPRCPVVKNDDKEEIINLINDNKCLSLEDLIVLSGNKPDSIYKLIADNEIYVDLLNYRITAYDRTFVFLNKISADAYKHLSQNKNGYLYENCSTKLSAIKKVSWDGKIYTVLQFGNTNVTLQNDDETPSLKIQTFEKFIDDGEIKIIESQNEDFQGNEIQSILKTASPNALAKATERWNIIRPIIQGDFNIQDVKTPQRTVERWVSEYKTALREFGIGYIGLIPKINKQGKNSGILLENQVNAIEYIRENKYEQPKKISISAAYRQLDFYCTQEGIICPSEKTFRTYLNKRKDSTQIRKREGSRAAYSYETEIEYYLLEGSTPKHGVRPFHICHIDHTELDEELVDSIFRRNLGKAWLTLMLDAFSRRVLAFDLSFYSPSYVSCMSVIRECVRRFQRMPSILILDNGKEFDSTPFESLMGFYEVTKKSRPRAKSRYGNVVERMFGVTNTELIYSLLGNTQASKKVRTMTKSVNPKNLAVWTLPEFQNLSSEYFYNHYDTLDHTTLQCSPRLYFERSMQFSGFRDHKIILYSDSFLTQTMPSTPKGTVTIDSSRGVKVNYVWYWHKYFRNPKLHKTSVPVKIDPWDIGYIKVFLPGGWVTCKSEHYSTFKERSRKEIEIISKEYRKKFGNSRKIKKLNGTKLAELISHAEKTENRLLHERKNAEHKIKSNTSALDNGLENLNNDDGTCNNVKFNDDFFDEDQVDDMEDYY